MLVSSRSVRIIPWPFDFFRKHGQMLRQPGEQGPFHLVGRKTADRRAFGSVGAQLFEMRQHVFHDLPAYFGACRPGELIHSSMWDAVSA